MRFLLVLLILCFTSVAHAEDFQSWLSSYKQRAIATGVPAAVVNRALYNIAPNDMVIRLDQKQPEGHMTLAEYVEKTVTPKRIETGKQRLAENRALLSHVQQIYGVPPSIIVALWGKESEFGSFMGNTETISALATLAYEGRRRAFFEQELLNAIVLTQRLNIDPRAMTGSWAGAIGQCQFMPSNYIKFALDGNGNRRVDLWRELPDVFASMANLLVHEGWRRGEGWGQRVDLPPGFDKNLLGRDKAGRDIRFWEQLGVQFNQQVPASNRQNIRLYQPDGTDGPSYALYPNFDVLMRWNHSGYFATAVGRLSDHLENRQ
ncbi:MAG: lytic murein transglycosylase [Alphaproteobacteria bacterium]|nr:lytic murein transglycosylase [Alphaproteobacteria bacterium]